MGQIDGARAGRQVVSMQRAHAFNMVTHNMVTQRHRPGVALRTTDSLPLTLPARPPA